MIQSKFVFSLLAAIGILTSCKKENTDEPEGNRLAKIVVRQVGSSPDSVGVVQFKYDNNNRLISIEDRSFNMDYKNTFQYDATGRLIKSERTYPNVAIPYISTYTYQNNLLKLKTETNSTGIESMNSFTYTATGKIATDTFTFTPIAFSNDYYNKFSFDANNNLEWFEDYERHLSGGAWSTSRRVRADATFNNGVKNPFYANGVGALYYLTNTWLVPVVKNMLLSEHLVTKVSKGYYTALPIISTYNYEFYSSNNLPKNATVANAGGGSNYTIEFFYE